MKPLPRISDAEWTVMRAVWDDHPLTANEVVERVAQSNDWSPQTVKTLLNRLVKKGALGFRQEGRAYHYYPIVAETDCVRAETRSFVQRVLNGSLTPMVAHFLEEESLTTEEIAQLRRLLDEKQGRGKS